MENHIDIQAHSSVSQKPSKYDVLSSFRVRDGYRFAPTEAHEYYDLAIHDISLGNHGMFEKNVGPVGLFTNEAIRKGSLVMTDGGAVIQDIGRLPELYRGFGSIIGEGLWLVPSDFSRRPKSLSLNHSCSPNLDRSGLFGYVANRNILKDEELSIDFAPYVASLEWWKFDCICGNVVCRKTITGNDWLNPELANKFWSQWLPFIQKRICANQSA